ncbi:MbtH family protein [Amycolatopsis kentuckyensis]|uniref:MbtH family protein n=1 Tax=Amycolatopsis kentuckyensis TaxID=218823 RepID=UPI000A39A476|nr:MbtH family protein [Amycolatopsis kentuckyensis]
MSETDGHQGDWLVLVNEEEQHSLWPGFVAVPSGWRIAHGPDARDSCLTYVERAWPDIRPRSVRTALTNAATAADATDRA